MARGRRGAKPLSLQTRHRRLVALGSLLRFCAREEWFVVGLDARGTTSLDDLEVADQPLLVVVRSEGSGLSRLVGETCDLTVAIPMAGPAESLNASVAAAVTLAEIARLRRAGYPTGLILSDSFDQRRARARGARTRPGPPHQGARPCPG
jgi:hypothetical protein